MANPSKVLARVQELTSHGQGVYTVVLAVPGRYTRYLPGQFLHLTLDDFDPTTGYWPESRVFSIASAPRQDHVTIVYSVKGSYTQRMERELAIGREVWLKFPYGDFIIDEDLLATGPVVLIAGGTGISPYLPFLLKERETTGVVHLFYGLRRPEHLLFGKDLIALRDRPWFQWHLSVEEGKVEGVPSTQGRLSIDLVAQTLGTEFNRASFFLSGPPAMIRAFQADLTTKRISQQQIHIDEWE